MRSAEGRRQHVQRLSPQSPAPSIELEDFRAYLTQLRSTENVTEVRLHSDIPPLPATPQTEDIEANEHSDQVEDSSQHHAPDQQNAATHVQGGTGSVDGGGQKLPAKQTVPIRQAIWCPWWLQPAVFAVFAGTFSCFIIALSIMIWYSDKHAGLLSGGFRFVVTIALTLLSVSWARVELQAKRYMPWISAFHTETPDAVDYNLDYMSMMLPTVLVKSLRQKHYLVFLVAVTSLLLKTQIVLAPGLFLVKTVQFLQPIDVKILDTFKIEPGTILENDNRAYYTAQSTQQLNGSFPLGAAKGAAYQRFNPRGKSNAPISAAVDTFFVDISCLKLGTYNFSEREDDPPNRRLYDFNFGFEGCDDVSFQVTYASMSPSTYLDEYAMSGFPLKSHQPCPGFSQPGYQFDYLALKREGVADSKPSDFSAVICSPRNWISKVEVIDDGISPVLGKVAHQAQSPIELDLWTPIKSSTPTSTLPNRHNESPIELRIQAWKDQHLEIAQVSTWTAFNMKLGTNLTPSSSTEALLECMVQLAEYSGPLAIHYGLRRANEVNAVGQKRRADRLVANFNIGITMVVVFALMTASISCVLIRYKGSTRVWQRDPATALGSMVTFCDYPELKYCACHLKKDDRNTRRGWSRAGFVPLALRTRVRIVFVVVVVGLMAILNLTLPRSKQLKGISTFDEHRHLTVSSFATIVALVVTLFASSYDTAIRSLHVLSILTQREATTFDRLDLSMIDAMGTHALFTSFRFQIWAVSLSQVVTFFCAFLTIASSTVFALEYVPKPLDLQLQQRSWFGDRPLGDNFQKYQENRQTLGSMLLQTTRGNITYPRNTFDDLAFPILSNISAVEFGNAKNIGAQIEMPSARLAANCTEMDADAFEIRHASSNNSESERATVSVDVIVPAVCPDGEPFNITKGFWIMYDHGSSATRLPFAKLLYSEENMFDARTYICCVNDTLIKMKELVFSPSITQTHLWGEWDRRENRFSFLRMWKCHYSCTRLIVTVNMILLGGEWAIDSKKPPRPDLSATAPWDQSISVPYFERNMEEKYFLSNLPIGCPFLIVREQNINDTAIDLTFRFLIEPHGPIPADAFGDPAMEQTILDELHHNRALISAQLANLKSRLGIDERSNLTTFPPESLDPVDAILIDCSNRRIVQNTVETYILTAILGVVAAANILALLSSLLRRWRPLTRGGIFDMNVKGLAPKDFQSISMTAALLESSNATEHIPIETQSLSREECDVVLSGLRFRLGWFRRESDQTRRFTIGVMGDANFTFLGNEENVADEGQDETESLR
ncbi:hypothetical protein CSOJ01_00436 [Colletotrichum sojae]|uniref:Uncharacterized protein n=1 Tax=Colletotrichum sojae TaxID=2175907 RepID=A0A8H6JY73_9PEZI|nr:hypothetical protein CSOJ01_00436 [Colletotrichum sojae]